MSETDGPRLVFVDRLATPEGFRSGEGTDDEIVVRELVQNALDAGADTVDFCTVRLPVAQVPTSTATGQRSRRSTPICRRRR